MYPTHQSVYVGGTIRFFCDIQEKKKWKFMGGKLPSNAEISGKLDRIVTIVNAQKHNLGAYRCVFRTEDKLVTSSGFLLVMGK